MRKNELVLEGTTGLPEPAVRALQELRRYLRSISGIGYAIHPLYVKRLLNALEHRPHAARKPYESIPPVEVQIRRSDVISLQRDGATAHGEAMSPIGIFSVDDDGSYYAGWSTKDRKPAEKNDAWRNIAGQIQRVGRNFILSGYDVVAYRRARRKSGYTYGYWAVAVRLTIVDG